MPELISKSSLKNVLIDENEIKAIVERLAAAINRDYEGKKLIIICVLKGSFIFMGDLVRKITQPATVEFVKASSYKNSSVSSGDVKIEYMSYGVNALKGSHVLVIDDILDTGNTLSKLVEHYKHIGAESVELCVLLDKPSRRTVPLEAKYTGKIIPDKFVVGYGLDYAEQYRCLPYVAAVEI